MALDDRPEESTTEPLLFSINNSLVLLSQMDSTRLAVSAHDITGRFFWELSKHKLDLRQEPMAEMKISSVEPQSKEEVKIYASVGRSFKRQAFALRNSAAEILKKYDHLYCTMLTIM
jgi:hypothetical protein